MQVKMTVKKVKANPPLHAIILVSTILLICLKSIPGILHSIDDVATIETCVTPIFPHLVSRFHLGCIRLAFACFIFCISLYGMSQEQVLQINYLKGSKLRSQPIKMGGLRSQAMFTSWAWNILGLSFAFSGIFTLYIDQQMKLNLDDSSIIDYDHDHDNDEVIQMLSSKLYIKYALRTTMILFEIAAPASMLVSAVVRYVLWPKAMKKGANGSMTLREPHILIQHNVNIIMSLIEVGLLGGIYVRFTDMAVAPLFGILFILFSWSIKNYWVESGEPQFLYFFLDTTLNGYGTSIALGLLVFVLMLFYGFFVLVEDLIGLFGGGLIVHLGVVVSIASLVCRFRD